MKLVSEGLKITSEEHNEGMTSLFLQTGQNVFFAMLSSILDLLLKNLLRICNRRDKFESFSTLGREELLKREIKWEENNLVSIQNLCEN